MRIVSGSLKGRRFSPPKSFRARPTTDTARESLFNILGHTLDFEDMAVLDLFSGTGAISYEFASRGCLLVTSVEKDFHHFKFIQKCVEELELTEIIKPVKADVFTFLKSDLNAHYDIVFADPPFELRGFEEVVEAVMSSNVLKEEGLFILEHGPQRDFTKHSHFTQVRKYGKVCFSFFSA
jgi:16S rRNA (guanine966-N2)-methyltransferase